MLGGQYWRQERVLVFIVLGVAQTPQPCVSPGRLTDRSVSSHGQAGLTAFGVPKFVAEYAVWPLKHQFARLSLAIVFWALGCKLNAFPSSQVVPVKSTASI